VTKKYQCTTIGPKILFSNVHVGDLEEEAAKSRRSEIRRVRDLANSSHLLIHLLQSLRGDRQYLSISPSFNAVRSIRFSQAELAAS
jgi:hypothetical protein